MEKVYVPKGNNFKRDYFIEAAKEFNESVLSYYDKTPYNYVIVERGEVITWESNNCPIIFGGIEDALDELRNWALPIKDVSIITEKEMIDTYCRNEMAVALIAEMKAKADSDENMLTYFMTPYNSHSKELVLKINRLWKKDKEKFRPILLALYERDIDEITDADSFQITKWIGSWQWNWGVRENDWKPYMDMAIEDMKERWEEFAENYLMHIADDGDLETIINFIRDKEIHL